MTDKPQPPLQIAVVPVTPFQQNCSVLWCTKTNQAAIVDPGGDVPRLLEALKEFGVTPVAIWLTHGHLDHAGRRDRTRRGAAPSRSSGHMRATSSCSTDCQSRACASISSA